jgi:pimeloyl-ACP methyl ester carboxylesterase
MAKAARKRSGVHKRTSPKVLTSRPPVPRPARARAVAVQAHGHSEFELTNEHIEASLRTGEHSGLLEDYFGPEEYAQLRQLSRDASARSVRGGPKVLILPGIMGSKIGKPGRVSLFDDVYWFDPVDIAAGRLTELALSGAPSRFQALGVMLIAYLKLKLRLQIGGYDPEFHAFDWRQSIADLGRDLAAVIKAKGGDKVNVVAHSMGGLVARWALGSGAKCRRFIMLGTPNYGSFASVMALRGTYPLVRKMGALDLKHTPEDLARDVFSTFPGLTQMMPSPERFRELDLYDLANWPQPDDGLRPRSNLLSDVKAVQNKLAAGDERFFLIAGVDQQTVTAVRKDDAAGGFSYEFSNAGDGTVALDFARMPGVPTFYVNESHGSLPNNGQVARTVLDLLDRADTSVLPRSYDAEGRRGAVSRVSESELRTEPYAGRRGVLLSQRELRNAVEEVAAPYAREEVPVPAMPGPAAVLTADGLEAGYRHPFDHVVVGRRRQHRIDLRFAFGSITEADTRALAVGVFRDVAPSGAAGALDQRLDGAITDVTRRRMFSGDVGEIFILPTGRHPIAADYIAFVGLGSFDRFTNEVLQIAAENLIRTFVSCQVEEFATVLFGAGSGEGPGATLRSLLAGFIRGLTDADKDHHFRRLVICETNQERYTQLKAELYRLSSTALCQNVEFTFDEVHLKAPLEAPRAALPARRAVDPVYLIVRQEQSGKNVFDVRSSVLTAGSKATVVTGVQNVKDAELRPLITRLVSPAIKDLSSDGDMLGKLLLSDEVRAVLPRFKDHDLVVVHDAAMSLVPWETLAFVDGNAPGKAWFPAGEHGLTHRYAAENLSVAKWLEERLDDDVFSVLLVVNPTEDLDGAEDEGQRVQKLFNRVPGCRLETLRGAAATRPALLSAFASGKYDLIHYAGHASFDEQKPERSGILCHGKAVLSGADLAGLGNLPTLVFFNACEAGRLRGGAVSKASHQKVAEARVKKLGEGISFAEAFMRGGVANFVATYWPVGDEAAKVFAETFYLRLMKGTSIGEAVQEGRGAVKETGSKDWADYIFYGDPQFVLKTARNADRQEPEDPGPRENT